MCLRDGYARLYRPEPAGWSAASPAEPICLDKLGAATYFGLLIDDVDDLQKEAPMLAARRQSTTASLSLLGR
jgi:hypothetical protein